MAESTIVKNMRDGTLTLISGADTYVIAYEQGTLNFQVPGPSVAHYPDRGTMGDPPALRYDQDQPPSGTFTAYLRDISDATDETLAEFIFKSGAVGGWTSTLGANAEVKTCTLRWDVAGLTHGDAADHRVEFAYCHITGGIQEGSPSVVTINFTSFKLYPTVT